MKLLFLANRIPYPPYRGDKLKIFNLARRLATKHELYLLTFTETKEDKQYKEYLEQIFKEVHLVHLPRWKGALHCAKAIGNNTPFQVAYFQSSEMTRKVASLLQQHTFDAIHVQHLRMAPYLSQRKELKRILDLPDAFSLYWKRREGIERGWLRSIFERIEQKRLVAFEHVVKEYQLSLVCSAEDQQYLRELHGVDNIKLLPNGVDLTTFAFADHDYSHNHTLLFTGNMDYAPNVDAVIYFVQEVLPLIHEKFPAVKFVIAGQRPLPKVLALANERVFVTGFVRDLAAVYNGASIVVAPLRFGAGTQNKVLEAMAMGIPVVCSNIGFKGLGITNGEGAVMETDKHAFAAAVCRLLASGQLRSETGTKGRDVVRTRFDWDVIAIQLEQYLRKVSAL